MKSKIQKWLENSVFGPNCDFIIRTNKSLSTSIMYSIGNQIFLSSCKSIDMQRLSEHKTFLWASGAAGELGLSLFCFCLTHKEQSST